MSVKYAVRRTVIQVFATAVQNPFVQNLWTGVVFKGSAKAVCAPGLNCWSCPAAALACPIGAMQFLATSPQSTASFYAIGFIVLLGSLVGRMVCGFLCAFGFLQDLLYKIPVPKLKVPPRADSVLRKMKYVVLVFLVLLLPALVTDDFGLGEPWFCAYLCPAGTLEAGIPLLVANSTLRGMISALFSWKVVVAVTVVVAAVLISRPFCKYLCPLGAFYGLFNRVSVARLTVNPHMCVGCGCCKEACPMDIDVVRGIETSPECIRCGACRNACTMSAIDWTLAGKKPGKADGPA